MLKKFLITLPLLLIAVTGTAYLYVNNRAQAAVDSRLEQWIANGTYNSATYDDIQVDINGDVSLTNLHLSTDAGEFILQDILVTNLDYAHEIPWHMDVNVSGVQFPGGLPDLDDSGNTALSQFIGTLIQNDTLPLNVKYLYQYDPGNAFQIDSDMSMAVDQAFTFNMRSTTRNIDLETLADMSLQNADPEAAQALMMQKLQDLEVPSAYFSLQDQGLVAAMLAISAEQNGTTPEDLRTMLIAQARNFYLFAPQDIQGFAMSSGTQVAAFLEGGKTLAVNVQPQMEGKVQLLQQEVMTAVFSGNFARIVELLNLEITAL